MQRVWKDITDFKGLYQISNFGQVKSNYTNKILKNKLHPKGYFYIGLHKNKKKYSKKIHRLVAGAFTPNPEKKPQVNHKDEDKGNNKVDNLEWATQSENIQHSMKLNGKQYYASMLGRRGKDSPHSKKLFQYSLSGKLIRVWAGLHEMQRNLGFNRQGIYYHIKNRTKSVYGFRWRV